MDRHIVILLSLLLHIKRKSDIKNRKSPTSCSKVKSKQ